MIHINLSSVCALRDALLVNAAPQRHIVTTVFNSPASAGLASFGIGQYNMCAVNIEVLCMCARCLGGNMRPGGNCF